MCSEEVMHVISQAQNLHVVKTHTTPTQLAQGRILVTMNVKNIYPNVVLFSMSLVFSLAVHFLFVNSVSLLYTESHVFFSHVNEV